MESKIVPMGLTKLQNNVAKMVKPIQCLNSKNSSLKKLREIADWCSGRLRCGDLGRCMDPIHCCDPQEDANCPIIQECCQEYISLKRYYLQIGIEQSGKLPKTKHHLFVIVGKFHTV